MKEYLISFETAKLAKEAGFFIPDEAGTRIRAYDTNGEECLRGQKREKYLAPTQSLLQKWLREEHKIQIRIQPTYSEPMTYLCFVNREYVKDPEMKDMGEIGRRSGVMLDHVIFDTYEEALEKGLEEALKLIK